MASSITSMEDLLDLELTDRLEVGAAAARFREDAARARPPAGRRSWCRRRRCRERGSSSERAPHPLALRQESPGRSSACSVTIAQDELQRAGLYDVARRPVIRPKLTFVISFIGKPNCTWLKALNASMRTDSYWACHGIRKIFASARSTFLVPSAIEPVARRRGRRPFAEVHGCGTPSRGSVSRDVSGSLDVRPDAPTDRQHRTAASVKPSKSRST